MTIRIALCDDDPRALPVIAGAVESVFSARGIQAEIFRFLSGETLLQATERTHFDLLLLDIEMSGMDGIAVGKRLRAYEDDIKIVYVSEAESRVFESFQVQPFGFVRKSNFLNDISTIVELYAKTGAKEQPGEYLGLATRSGLLSLRSKQVRYFEASRNYQLLYLAGKKEPLEVKMTMDKLQMIAEPYGFIRVHKGYLVNYQYIQHISSTEITLADGTQIPIGRSKVSEVKLKFLSLIGK